MSDKWLSVSSEISCYCVVCLLLNCIEGVGLCRKVMLWVMELFFIDRLLLGWLNVSVEGKLWFV